MFILYIMSSQIRSKFINHLDDDDERFFSFDLIRFYDQAADLLNREKEVCSYEKYCDLGLYDGYIAGEDSEKKPINDNKYKKEMNMIENDRREVQDRLRYYNAIIELSQEHIGYLREAEKSISEYAKALNNNRLKYGLEGKLKQTLDINTVPKKLQKDVKEILDQSYSEKPIGGKTRKSNKTQKSYKKSNKI